MSALPSGTVTFLFTDIEGSTQQWDAYTDAMGIALRRHDALMREAVESQNGRVFKTIGDAFCAAFHTALDALNAALAAQRMLVAEPWPEPIRIRVRMALHTGTAEERDGDYYGPTLNRVARLLSLANGGQCLIASATQELLMEALPAGVSLQSLGEHRLRDLSRAEHVFQLLHPDLPGEFAALKSLGRLPNNLPEQLTFFVGREQQIAHVRSLIQDRRLLTLTGSGGCGKTRLAVHVAADILADHPEDFPDGVWLVELASVADPALVAQEVATVLSVKEQAGQTLQQTLAATLQARKMLLLLDNCEHLVGACADLVAGLVRQCTGVKVLATSREPLNIAGEQAYHVPPLSLPDPKHPPAWDALPRYEAASLFIDRARLVRPDFSLNELNASALTQICCRLDGIPLAIELAAARVRSMSLEDIDARLDSRFRILTGGDRTALPRQRALRALIDWSYDLLSAQEKRLMERLSVFAGGWTLEAAEQVAAGEDAGGVTLEDWEIVDLLTSLVDKSLVIVEDQEGTTRYRMLETVRQYAMEKLAAGGTLEIVRTRHREFAQALIRSAVLSGPETGSWAARLETEHDNLRAALVWCAQQSESAQIGLEMTGGLAMFWSLRGYYSEGRDHLTKALERAGAQERTHARANALYGSGMLAWQQGDYAEARVAMEESLGIEREFGNPTRIAMRLNLLGVIALCENDLEQARTCYEESLQLQREAGSQSGIAIALVNLSQVAQEQGDFTRARAQQEEGLAIFRELRDARLIAMCLQSVGAIALRLGDRSHARVAYSEALQLARELDDRRNTAEALYHLGMAEDDLEVCRALYEEALALQREIGDRRGTAVSLDALGGLAHREGNEVAAHSLYCEALGIFRELGPSRQAVHTLDVTADTLLAQGQFYRACRLMGAARELREKLGATPFPYEHEEQEQRELQARSALDDAAFADAWAEGHAMTFEQAVKCAMEPMTG